MKMNMIERRKRNRGQGGFTLIELLVVIAILGILAGVAVFAVNNLTDDAGANACDVEGQTLKTAGAAAKASSITTDSAATFIEGGANGLKYFNIDGTRKNTAEVPAADCAAVTVPA
jgi:prepilin-type N-terminal cleavage/methylation domain-containing protein